MLLLAGFALPASAQFRTKMRTANKQYEIHAYNLAIQSYKEALERKPDDAEALGKLADCYRHLNQMNDAAQYYAQAVKITGADKEYLVQYGHVLRALGRYDEAKQWYLQYARESNAMIGNQYAQSCDFAKGQLSNAAGYSISPEVTNTPASDFGPTLASRGQIIFASSRTDMIAPGSFSGSATNHLFVTTVGNNGFLNVPYLLRTNYQAEGSYGPAAYSPDGALVAFTKNNFVDGARQIPSGGMQMSLFLAQVNPSGEWVDVRPFPFNGTAFSTGYANFAPDGQALYFASDRPDGFGGFDVYVSYRVGNSWSTPENLGPVVNSPGHELTPFYDGTNVYFSSDWHHGLGGFDVFRAEKSNNRWTQIFHLGAAINSPADDYGFVFDGAVNRGYLVSNRNGGSGNEDIYRVTRAADNITLIIRNAADGSPIGAAIVDFADCGEAAYQADARGLYTFQVVQGLNCNVVIRKDGFSSATVPLGSVLASQQREVTVNLSRINESYVGKVVDYTSRRPLSGVRIAVLNRSSGARFETTSDSNGDYYVALSPYTTYDFRLSYLNYRDLDFTLPVEDGVNRSILGVVTMLPVTAPANTNPVTPTGTTGTSGTGTPTPTGTNPGGATQPVANGFAVQLASTSQQPNLSQFANVQNLGQVYSVQEGGRYKVRVGVFATRTEAERALASAKGRGYSGAFIVAQAGVTAPATGTTTKTGVTSPATSPSSSAPYKVQLGAYSNPQNFNTAKATALGGTLETEQKGNLTVYRIGGLNTLEEARALRARAQAAGFTGAYAVVNENGQLRKID